MTKRTPIARLQDILSNIQNVDEFLKDKTLADFKSDALLRLAVERALEIISEASRHIPDREKARYPDIPWQDVKSIGNVLRHDYQRLDAELIWAVERHILRPANTV